MVCSSNWFGNIYPKLNIYLIFSSSDAHPATLCFRVKFYPSDPSKLREEITRWVGHKVWSMPLNAKSVLGWQWWCSTADVSHSGQAFHGIFFHQESSGQIEGNAVGWPLECFLYFQNFHTTLLYRYQWETHAVWYEVKCMEDNFGFGNVSVLMDILT